MKIGGVSVMGSYHEKNQDYFLASSFDFGDLICVSDGVGSCRYSEIGSRNACFSLRTMIEKNKGIPSADNELNKFIESFHSEWVKNVTSELPEGATVDDCCATLLFCFCAEGNAIAGRLGDGFVGIKMSNGNDILFDRKEGRLENETYSLYEHYEPSEWEIVEIADAELIGVICCTDGASPYPYDYNGCSSYLDSLISEYLNSPVKKIESDIQRWLPEFNGSDDKTMVFMIEENNDGQQRSVNDK